MQFGSFDSEPRCWIVWIDAQSGSFLDLAAGFIGLVRKLVRKLVPLLEFQKVPLSIVGKVPNQWK